MGLEKYNFTGGSSADLSSPPEPYPREDCGLRLLMMTYLTMRKLCVDTARANMWYPVELDGPRIVIPCVNGYGRPYWQARSMSKSKVRYRSARGGRFESIVVVWPEGRNHILRTIVLTEGPMDALAAAGLGYLAVSTMGAFFCKYALRWINQNVSKDVLVIVVPDLDMPEFGVEVVRWLAAEGRSASMRLPVGAKDLAEMSVSARRALLI